MDNKISVYLKNIKKNGFFWIRSIGTNKPVWYGSGYGGFFVSDDIIKHDPIVVFDFGIGEDISFDIDLAKRWNAVFYAFDPTPKSIKYISEADLPSKFNFFSYGISDKDGVEKFYLPKNEEYVSGSSEYREELKEQFIEVPMKSFSSILKDTKVSRIDILKLDIEGSEYRVIKDIMSEEIEIKQICIELHGRFFKHGRKLNSRLIQCLNKNGYKCIAISDTVEELTFAKLED